MKAQEFNGATANLHLIITAHLRFGIPRRDACKTIQWPRLERDIPDAELSQSTACYCFAGIRPLPIIREVFHQMRPDIDFDREESAYCERMRSIEALLQAYKRFTDRSSFYILKSRQHLSVIWRFRLPTVHHLR